MNREGDLLGRCTTTTQRKVVAQLVGVLLPFGSLDPDVVDPNVFESHATTLMDRLRTPVDTAGVGDILRDLDALPALRSTDEPAGIGFFALGAVAELIYAAQLILGEPRAAQWALSRASDVLGFADDELGTQSREQMLAWVADVAGVGDVREPARTLEHLATSMASQLAGRGM